jgi:hypothetical protein
MSISARTRQSTWSTDAPEAPVARNLGICLIGGLPHCFYRRAARVCREVAPPPLAQSPAPAKAPPLPAAPRPNRSRAPRPYSIIRGSPLPLPRIDSGRKGEPQSTTIQVWRSAPSILQCERDCRATGETTFAPIYAPFCSQSTRTLAPCSERLASCVSTGEAACCRNRSWLRRLQNDVV